MSGGGCGGHASADRFAEEDEGLVVGDQSHGFVGRGEESALRGSPGTRAVAWVFEDIDREGAVGRGGAEDRGVVGAVHGVTGVAVGDENGEWRTRVFGRGEDAVADDSTLRVVPRLEPLGAGFPFERCGVVVA